MTSVQLPPHAVAAAGLKSNAARYGGLGFGIRHVDLNKNWAGAMYVDPNNTFQSVTTTVTIPAFTSGSVSLWIGIDGYICNNAALHVGLNLTVGQVTPWYRLYPNDPKPFPTSLAISTGDLVRMTVSTASDHFGSVQIQNLNSTLEVVEQIFILNPNGGLCRSEVMWLATWDGPLAYIDIITLSDMMAVVGYVRMIVL